MFPQKYKNHPGLGNLRVLKTINAGKLKKNERANLSLYSLRERGTLIVSFYAVCSKQHKHFCMWVPIGTHDIINGMSRRLSSSKKRERYYDSILRCFTTDCQIQRCPSESHLYTYFRHKIHKYTGLCPPFEAALVPVSGPVGHTQTCLRRERSRINHVRIGCDKSTLLLSKFPRPEESVSSVQKYDVCFLHSQEYAAYLGRCFLSFSSPVGMTFRWSCPEYA